MNSFRFARLAAVSLGLVALAGSLPAHADIVFTDNNGKWETFLHQYSLNKENVLFNGNTDVTLGNPVIGHTNQTNIQYDVHSTFNGSLKINNDNGGQAKVSTSNHKSFFDATIDQTQDNPFRALMFYVDTKGNASGTDTVTVNIGTDANPVYVTHDFFLAQGENQIGLVAFHKQQINSVTISGDVPLDDIRQIRVAGAQGPGIVPEAGSLWLLVSGGLPLGLVWRKRRPRA